MNFYWLLISLLSLAAACEDGGSGIRKSRPTADGAEVPGFEAESTTTAKAGKPISITLGQTSIKIPEGATNEDAVVRLRVLKSTPEREELVGLGDPISDVVEITFYQKTSKEIYSSNLFSDPYQVKQRLDDLSDPENINYYILTGANTSNEKIQVLDRDGFEISEGSLSLTALIASLDLQIGSAIFWAAVGKPPAGIVIVSSGSDIESIGGGSIVDDNGAGDGGGGGGGDATANFAYEWVPMEPNKAPSPRYSHTAVWTGTKMIIWGGYDGSITNTGGIYDPAEKKWTETTIDAINAPPRTEHAAVWLGSKMLIYGGRDSSGDIYQSILFDPEENTWEEFGDSVTPSRNPTAVWTGQEAIFWGGHSYDGITEASLSYSPSNGWQTITNAEKRVGHTAIWNSSEMIVWGGQTGEINNFVATGFRFDPSNSQRAELPASPLRERSYHSAVWTGEEMLIWGGSVFATTLDTGAKFAESKWTEMPTTKAPSPRRAHTAVWTGKEMLVYGGETDETGSAVKLGTGGIYDPRTELWRELPTEGAPSARSRHTAVWTGSQMIIWGGISDSAKLGDGAIFQ